MLVIIYNTDYDTVIIWWNSNYGQQQKLWNEEWRSCALSSYGHLCRAGTLKMGGAFEKSEFLLNTEKLAFEYWASATCWLIKWTLHVLSHSVLKTIPKLDSVIYSHSTGEETKA